MDIVESSVGRVVVLMLTGRLDSTNVPPFSARVNALFDAGSPALVMDMTNLSYVTSASFRALALARRRAKDCGAELALCGLNTMVRELFDLTGFTDSFAIYVDRDSAIAALET